MHAPTRSDGERRRNIRWRRCAGGSPAVYVHIVALLALSCPLVCCSEGAHRSLRVRTAFVPLAHRIAQDARAGTPRLCIATAGPALLHVARRGDEAVRDRNSVVWPSRVHDLGPVRDTPRADAGEQSVGEVKELSSDLMVPGVAMVVTMPVTDKVGLVTKEDVDAGSCWIAVNGIPLQATKFDFRSNFWGTRRSLDLHVRIPPEHLDEAGLGLLYPGEELSLAKMQESDALDFKAKFAEAKRREREDAEALLRVGSSLKAQDEEQDVGSGVASGVQGGKDDGVDAPAEDITALKAELDLQ